MNNTTLERFSTLGVNWKRTMERFINNEQLYLRYFVQFAEDEYRRLLLESVSCGDKENIERTAHTLKGVSANLGLEKLAHIYSQIVDHVRMGGEVPLDILMEEERQAYHDYKELVEEIKK